MCRQYLARASASAATENFDVIFCVCQAETDIFFSTNEVPFKLDKEIQIQRFLSGDKEEHPVERNEKNATF